GRREASLEDPIAEHVLDVGLPPPSDAEELLRPRVVADELAADAARVEIEALRKDGTRELLVVDVAEDDLAVRAEGELAAHLGVDRPAVEPVGVEVEHRPAGRGRHLLRDYDVGQVARAVDG